VSAARCLLALAWVGLLSAPARALEAPSRDYRPDSPAWNGLSRFVEQAAAQGCAVTPADALDWQRLSARDVLFFVYPQSPVDAAALGEFLVAGGRVLLADDFGAAAPAFEVLQLHRAAARLDGVPREPGHPELPVARVKLLTSLGRSTPRLVTNHPAAFETTLPPTYELSPAQALVVEGRVGRGRFVALADPSVLINNMLELEGNAAFARALIAELCTGGSDGDRVHLYTGPFRSTTAPARTPVQGGTLGRLNDLLVALNRATEELLRGLFAVPIAVLICGAALLLAWRALSRTRSARHADGRFVRADAGGPRGTLAIVDSLPRGEGGSADHGLALLVLRHEVLRRVTAALGPVPSGISDAELVRRAGDRLVPELVRALERFLSAAPPGEPPLPPRTVGRRAFVRALSAARPILHRLDPGADTAPQGA
jgi:hypothetical protein